MFTQYLNITPILLFFGHIHKLCEKIEQIGCILIAVLTPIESVVTTIQVFFLGAKQSV